MTESQGLWFPVLQAEEVMEYGRVDIPQRLRRGNHKILLWRAENRKSDPPARMRITPHPTLPAGFPRKLE
jgi:hypothetical protein